ncbi:MAG: PilZ domain-containing protein, partial [Calditrichaeota bacterium]
AGKQSNAEKRASERFNCWCNLQFHHQAAWQRGIATDISETGMHVVTLHPLKKGSRVQVCLDEPGSLDYNTIYGEVVWRNDQSPFDSKNRIAPGMGIHFTSRLPVAASELAKNHQNYANV